MSSHKNLVSLLTTSSWGADPQTLRTTTLALCYSAAEYCASVWGRSAHAHKVNPVLNRACRVVTGNLRSTPLNALYRISGISPPDIRRDTIARVERHKQLTGPRHRLYQHTEAQRRLRSRKSFMTVSELVGTTPGTFRKRMWMECVQNNTNTALPAPCEELPPGTDLPRHGWVTLNRARSKTG